MICFGAEAGVDSGISLPADYGPVTYTPSGLGAIDDYTYENLVGPDTGEIENYIKVEAWPYYADSDETQMVKISALATTLAGGDENLVVMTDPETNEKYPGYLSPSQAPTPEKAGEETYKQTITYIFVSYKAYSNLEGTITFWFKYKQIGGRMYITEVGDVTVSSTLNVDYTELEENFQAGKVEEEVEEVEEEIAQGKTMIVTAKNGEENIRVSADSIYREGGTGTSGSKVLYFTNYARLFLNVKDDDAYLPMSTAYLIIYIALIAFTAMFTFRYMKRVIYMAFLTLMAPLVALTYPLDKVRDRKSTGLEYVV